MLKHVLIGKLKKTVVNIYYNYAVQCAHCALMLLAWWWGHACQPVKESCISNSQKFTIANCLECLEYLQKSRPFELKQEPVYCILSVILLALIRLLF